MTELHYTLVRKPYRRSITIHIGPDCSIEVRAPMLVSRQAIRELVRKRMDWIKKKQADIIERGDRIPARDYVKDETFLYLGKSLTLDLRVGRRRPYISDGALVVELPESELSRGSSIRRKVVEWYRGQADRYISERVRFYESEMGVKVAALRYKNLKSRWGSCSSKKNVNFNIKLMMAPPKVVDYVVVHELAHLIHMDHSPAFWTVVARYCPSYKRHVRHLREHGARYLL